MTGATKQDLAALHHLAQRLRDETPGAGKWHDNGLTVALDAMLGWNLNTVIETVRAHASDPAAKTPGAMRRGFLPDTLPSGRPAAFPPKAGDACPDHPGGWRGTCSGCAADALTGETPPARGVAPSRIDTLRAAHTEATAVLCPCGVRRCKEHQPEGETA